jgi:hypothetical protein
MVLKGDNMDLNEIPAEFTRMMPIEDALKILGFNEKNEYGNPQRTWGPVEVIVGPWVWAWKLLITIKRNSARSIYIPQEYSVPRNIMPINILVMIYCNCGDVFSNEELPTELMWGKMEWARYNRAQREEYEKRPKVWADKTFFRFCITYLEKRNDWVNEDYNIEFSHMDGQLKIKAKDDVVFCPAIGTFNGTLAISARQLFRRIPKRFTSPTVFIQVLKEEKATIGSHSIPACWIENKTMEEIRKETKSQ